MKRIAAAAGGLALSGAAAVAYAALIEVRWFALRSVDVPVLKPGSAPIKLLHISDLHLMPGQHRKQQWVRSLAELEPDLVVNTGDNISSADSVWPLLDCLDPLLELPGVFVSGSNDYFAPRPKNPVTYLFGPSKGPRASDLEHRRLPTETMDAAFENAGWLNLRNTRGELTVAGQRLEFAGVDDPHLRYDRYADVAGGFTEAADLRIGVTHAPYKRVLNAMSDDDAQLILAGHTHGGQLCVPGYGALITNCDLDRRRVKGLSRWGDAWLHVSAGLGTSPFAPVRFSCRPEATLLTLREAGSPL
ncbi:metallophosphoesterase [Saxibacter everestensis]|uniref:Metallophosphoesterase n=1 Tax=Saxibacter everestensis TaxID=2909229 RepID=A0ABY8QRP2_9MICO|nr:metallophosphoesterase [Brevibacteriaceae bacterium ZFBP1038]